MNDKDFRQKLIRHKPLIVGWNAGGSAVSASTSGTVGAHSHAEYMTETEGDARYPLIGNYNTHTADANAHHDRQHNMISALDHDFSTWINYDVLHKDEFGTVVINQLSHAYLGSIGENDHHNRQHNIIDANDHIVTAVQYSVIGTPAAANILAAWTAGDDGTVAHTLLKSGADGDITLSSLSTAAVTDISGVGLSLTPTYDLHIAAGGNIKTDDTQRAYEFYAGFPITGASINWETGTAVFKDLQIENLYAETFIAEAKRAYAGGAWYSKSATHTTRQFVVPAAGEINWLYVANIPGLTGFNAFDNGDYVLLRVLDVGQTIADGARLHDDIYIYTGVLPSGGATTYYGPENFSGYSANDNPTNWNDTGANNSLTTDDSLFTVQSAPGGGMAFHTSSGASNYHTHYNGSGYGTLTDYAHTGRFYLGSATGGIGFTVGSDYASTDSYYRVRRYGSGGTASFHVSNHGGLTLSGTTSSSFNPSASTWYNYRIEFEDTGSQTEVRARFWAEGETEPGTWHINAYDNSGGRVTEGTFGFWAHQNSSGMYIDDIEVESLGAGGGTTINYNFVPASMESQPRDVFVIALRTNSGASMTPPAGWTSIGSVTEGTHKMWVYVRTATAAESGTETFTATSATDTMRVAVYLVRGANAPTTGTFTSGTGTGFSIPAATVNSAPADVITLICRPNVSGGDSVTPSENLRLHGEYTAVPYYTSVTHYADSTGSVTGDSVSWSTSQTYLAVTLVAESGAGHTSSAIIASVWGQVTAISPSDLQEGEQAYRFTTVTASGGQGKIIPADSAVIDFGVSGDPYIEIDAYGPDSPTLSMSHWTGANPVSGTHTNNILLGRLDSATGNTNEFGLLAYANSNQYFRASTNQFELRGVPINMHDGGGTRHLTLGSTGSIQAGADLDAGDVAFWFNHVTGDLIVGDVSGGNYMSYIQSTGTLQVRGDIQVTSVDWSDIVNEPGNGDIDNMFHGATTPSAAGLYLGATNLGYHDGSSWKMYMNSSGNMYFGGATGARLQWDGTNLKGINSSSVTQWQASSTTGKLTAGGGEAVLHQYGIDLHASAAITDVESQLGWWGDPVAQTAQMGRIIVVDNSGAFETQLHINAMQPAGYSNSWIYLDAGASEISLSHNNGIEIDPGSTQTLYLNSLPTTLQTISGKVWNNNGMLAIGTGSSSLTVSAAHLRAYDSAAGRLYLSASGADDDYMSFSETTNRWYVVADTLVSNSKFAAGQFNLPTTAAPSTDANYAQLYIDSTDGGLYVKFKNGTTVNLASA